jgi:histidinol dehydrogenase
MRRVDWRTASPAERAEALARPARGRDPAVAERVAAIFADVRVRGADAVRDWAVRLDGAEPRRLEITDAAVADARSRVAPEDLEALVFAANAVRRFHVADLPADGPAVETVAGARSRRVWRPLQSAGLYVPGGTAPLFSTLLMLAIPAAVAGVPERVAVTPPSKDGGVHPMMVLAARAAGLDALWIVGGAQAVAALAFGAGVPRVEKIFGPGNAWVAEAKRLAAQTPGGPAIDLPAGPSELLVIADKGADATLVAVDLLSQAEHDADAQVLLVTPDPQLVERVQAELQRLLARLPRAEIARRSLEAARAVVCADLAEAVEIADVYAPEHLSLQVRAPERLVPSIRNAGTVFAGDYAAETFGDYVAGPSHVLPTDGAAT